jgi:Ca2+-binding RTX toxin-like protein
MAVGSAGTDRIFLDLSEDSAGVSFVFSKVTTTVDATTSFSSAESLWLDGTRGADNVTGGALGDVLEGNAGNDTLRGNVGDDELHDGDGNDLLFGDAGNDLIVRDDYDANGIDRIEGGAGIDTLRFNIVSDEAVILDMEEQQYNNGLAWGLTLKDIENVVGSERPDDIRGSASANSLWGGGGADVLYGRSGDDVLVGGEGGDVLVGGAGKDWFQFGADATASGDFIADFTRGEDKVAVARDAFGLGAGESLSLVTGTDPQATTFGAQFLFDTDSHQLWFDADGKGGDFDPTLVATLYDVGTLTAGDFVLV